MTEESDSPAPLLPGSLITHHFQLPRCLLRRVHHQELQGEKSVVSALHALLHSRGDRITHVHTENYTRNLRSVRHLPLALPALSQFRSLHRRWCQGSEQFEVCPTHLPVWQGPGCISDSCFRRSSGRRVFFVSEESGSKVEQEIIRSFLHGVSISKETDVLRTLMLLCSTATSSTLRSPITIKITSSRKETESLHCV